MLVAVRLEALIVAWVPVEVVLLLVKVQPTAAVLPSSSNNLNSVVVFKVPNPCVWTFTGTSDVLTAPAI